MPTPPPVPWRKANEGASGLIYIRNNSKPGTRDAGVYRTKFLPPKSATINTLPESHLAFDVALAKKEESAHPHRLDSEFRLAQETTHGDKELAFARVRHRRYQME